MLFTIKLKRSGANCHFRSLEFDYDQVKMIGLDLGRYNPKFISILQGKNEFSVIPTIFNHSIRVLSPATIDRYRLDIVNPQGDLVLSKLILSKGDIQIEMSFDLPKGVYFYHLYDRKTSFYNGKLIKL